MKPTVTDREFDKFREASNDKSKVAVTVEQEASNPIPAYIVFGNPVNIFGESLSDPDNEITVLNEIVSFQKLRVINVSLPCFIEGKLSVLVNGQTVATSRTAPGKPDAKIEFSPFIELAQGDTIEVKFKARPSSKVAEVESFINACEC